ncbi:LOW QUALITY PROTEIN: uncharacterized protein LOC118811097 [Colossoma macropomum]|uniref:LOW QUALITY PROTEIN: uncharacterized protein LOC118811097 n=1 Tax=Colossoma macropomum TaxID=42526 RepID=UPI0018652A47|nr:LOW QUALITY PROTEIN: uncharacterized protein LOC118811097 [Colossoma macropomum]
MKANKKTKPQRMGHWKGMSCSTLPKAGSNFALPFGINFMLAPSPHLNSALFSCPQLFAPTQAALLGLAQLEAQLVLNQLNNIAVGDHSGYCNPLLPSILHTYLSQNAAPLSLCQPPRAASYPLPKTSHAPSNLASDTIYQQMSTGIFPLVSADKLETANTKHQNGTGVMGAPQEQEQTLGSCLGKDKKVQADFHEAPLATVSCNHQQESQKTHTLTSSAMLSPATQYVHQHKPTRIASVAAPSRYTSGKVFEYGQSRRKSEWRKSPRGLACSKKTNQSWAYRDKSQSEWHEHHSPSQSISPSPSWSPSPPPLSHKRCSQSPDNSERYSPSDLIHGGSSSEYRSSKRTRDFSSTNNFCQEKSEECACGHHQAEWWCFSFPSSSCSNKSSKSTKKGHVPSPDLKQKREILRKGSCLSVSHSHCRYPSFKILKKDDHHASSSTSLHTPQQTSAQNVLQKTKNIIKKTKEPWVSVMPQSSKSCLNKAHLGLLGIPAEAKYQDVCRSLAPFGVIKELVFFPQLDKQSQVLAFLHMLKKEDAEALSKCQNLTICNKVITVVPYHQKPVVHTDGPQGKIALQQPMVLMESGEPNLITTPEVEGKKGVIRISGIPFDYSEYDLIQLVTPFGQPIKILIATEVDMDNGLDWKMEVFSFIDPFRLPKLTEEQKQDLDSPITVEEIIEVIRALPSGKSPGPEPGTFASELAPLLLDMYTEAFERGERPPTLSQALNTLVLKDKDPCEFWWCFSNELSALNIVQVYSVVPVHLKQFDVTLVPQTVDFSSPESLFQAFTAPTDPTGSLTPWEHLLVVSNVPDQPHIASEVRNLVQPFSKVLRTLALPEEKATDQTVSDDQSTHCLTMVFELKSSVSVSLACEWFQKTPCILYDYHLCFSMGTKPQPAKSGVIASSKSWNGLASDENCRVKHHDMSPWIHGSVEGILVLISGFPETMDSEDDFIQMAAPHGVPTKVVIAAAQRKALVELPDKHSAKKMVVAYNAIPIGLKQLDMKLLPDTVDINKPVSLFQVIMGPEHPGGKATDPHLLLTAGNVPDTVSGISQVQQLVQRYGAVNHTLILNNMVIFEMITSKVAKVAYKQLKKLPYTAHRGTLSFVWGSDPSVTSKEDVEDVPFDLDIHDFVSVDEVNDVIPLPAEPFTSTQPNRRPDTKMAGDIRSTEGIQHFPFSGEEGKQTYGKTKEGAKCRRNKKGRRRGQKQQDGTMNNVRLTSSNISDLPAVVENQVKIQMKTKQHDVTGLIHRRKCLLEKAKTFSEEEEYYQA